MIGCYQTIQFGGYVKRKCLHAPVSMDFKHTLRSYMTRPGQDMRNCIRIEKNEQNYCVDILFWLNLSTRSVVYRLSIDNSCLQSTSANHANLMINRACEDVMKLSRIPAKTALMREYGNQTLHCYARNRERYATSPVNG